MPTPLTYPGVYIEELPSGVRTITGVATSITAFVGRTKQGPVDEPAMIHNYGDYTRIFGGLWRESPLSYAVQQYFLNGGSDALIVRVHNGATASTISLPAGSGSLSLEAANPGLWGRGLTASVDHHTKDELRTSPPPDANLFNLTIEDTATGAKETYLNLSRDSTSPRFVTTVLENESNLVRVTSAVPSNRPDTTTDPVEANQTSGSDGNAITDAQISGSPTNPKRGVYALDNADLFNLLCIPPYHYDPASSTPDPGSSALTDALAYCKKRRAILIVDPPSAWNDKNDPASLTSGVDSAAFGLARDKNAVLYFPRILCADPLQENRQAAFAPCGAVAGIIARTDASRGLWKAPAGQEATILGAVALSVPLTDAENGELNPLGINCLRAFPVIGRVVWGARTLEGADRLASEWKYLSVRRTALYIEESLYRGSQWAVFEPNDEPLWSQLRLNMGAFMHSLFRQGAFQGQSPKDAYFVKCDKETTTQDDINKGIVNIIVGFAPLKPAEFVVIKLQQMAGQIQA